jgi:predicted transcriptional regulator
VEYPLSPAAALRAVREAAEISQRDLARLAGTSQSVIARIETGQVDPSWGTLDRLVRAAGGAVHLEIVSAPAFDPQLLDDVPRILALSPEDRLREVGAIARFVAEARRV